MSKLKSAARRHKRPLTVRMLVAQISWLEGRRLWQDGRVVWQHERGILTPSIADIASAQRCLNKIEKYPHAAKRILDDSENWLAKRWQLLEDTKYLQRLSAPDLELLVRDSRSRNPAAIGRLVQLLSAETACFDELPFRPSEALARNLLAIAPLKEFVQCADEPRLPRVLAALVLGSLLRNHGHDANWYSSDEALNRAWKFGNENGLPAVPSLTAYLLLHENGSALAKRCEYSLEKLPAEFRALLCEMIETGALPQRIVSLSESAAPFASIAAEINQFYRDWLEYPEHGSGLKHQRRVAEWRRAWLQSRDDILTMFWRLARDFIRALEHPWQVKQFRTVLTNLVHTVTRFQYSPDNVNRKPQTATEWTEAFKNAFGLLKPALQLPSEVISDYIELLGECSQSRWKVRKDLVIAWHQVPQHLATWLDAKEREDASPLFELLRKSGDAQIARDALRFNIHAALSRQSWDDTEMYRCFLNWYDEFLSTIKYSSFWELSRTLDTFRTAREARAALSPLFQAVRAEPQEIRGKLLQNALSLATDSRRERNSVFHRLGLYIPDLSRYGQQCLEYRLECDYYNAISGVLEIDGAWRRDFAPQIVDGGTLQDEASDEYSHESEVSEIEETASQNDARLWVQWTLEHLLELQKKSPDDWFDIEDAVKFCLALSGGNFSHYQSLFHRALRFELSLSHYIEKGLRAIRSFPLLQSALRHVFPRHPRRCVNLLSRWGMTAQLGADVLAPLQKLNVEGENVNALDEMWQFVPDALPLANRYCAAMRLLQKEEAAPKGVLGLLETPRKLIRELSFLEEKVQQNPERHELRLRAETIRQRLKGGEEKWASLRDEIIQRMEQATAEAWLEAAEQQLQKCYSLRLKQIVGTLPPDLQWTDDLLNATLLWSDIRCNKKWLRRLIDAYLQGEHDWREKHPGNILFLQVMRHRGLDVSAWLSVNAKSYRCSEAKGEKVRLQIENNALHILQMGNYFGTCLSFGGMNSFSTVANACELNKRVIYATDGEGKVVGRKLMAINECGELVGFHTYTSLSNTKANQAVRRIFRRYVKDFAQRCNLTLASEGNVPVLFVDEWYDDGIVNWNSEEEEKTS